MLDIILRGMQVENVLFHWFIYLCDQFLCFSLFHKFIYSCSKTHIGPRIQFLI